jgi:hypothetical protein
VTKTRLEGIVSIIAERYRQIEKWGVQHHPNGTGSRLMAAQAAVDRAICNEAFEHGNGTWRHILKEEVSEAFAEDDPEKLAEELIQVAAVALGWWEDIARQLGQVDSEAEVEDQQGR